MVKRKAVLEKKTAEAVQKVKIVAAPRVMMALAALFLIVWTLIGISLLVLMVQAQRQGSFRSLTNPPAQQQTQQQVPTETDIPGVGKVNIACVRDSLSAESIQKIVESGNASGLEASEKAKLDACIVK